MFDRLEDLLIRYEEVMGELQEPDVANDAERFRRLMKEQSDLAPIVEAYKEYKQCKQNVEDSLMMLEEESDEEMRELAKEEQMCIRDRFCLPGKTKDRVDDHFDPASAEVVYCPFKNRKFITSADISGSIGMDGLQSKLNPDRFDPVDPLQ